MTPRKGVEAQVTSDELRKLADAVCFDEPKLAPMFDWSQEPQIVLTDALRQAADEIDRLKAELAAANAVCDAAAAWGEHGCDLNLESLQREYDLWDSFQSALEAWRKARE